MPIFKTCVVVGSDIYCWDETRRRAVKAVLDIDAYAPIPEDVERRVIMKRFNLEPSSILTQTEVEALLGAVNSK